MELTAKSLKILQAEAELQEIVKLVGMDALSPEDRLTLDVAQSIREDFLQQNAFWEEDSYTPLDKQLGLLKLIFAFEKSAAKAIKEGVDINDIATLPVHEEIGRAKLAPNTAFEPEFNAILKHMDEQISELIANVEKI